MKLIITADIHNGVPGRLRDTIWAMDIISKYAADNNIVDIIVAGDLFHDRVSLNIEVVNEVYNSLKAAKSNGQNWYCFPGNHDMFLKNSWKMNSLHILESVLNVIEGVNVLELGGIKFVILPFVHYESNYMKIYNKLNNGANENTVLITHIGVCGATLNECFLLKNWNVVQFKDTNFRKIFTGHFHCHQQLDKVYYPGSPIAFKFDEGVVDHGFLVYDTESDVVDFINIYDVCSKYSDYSAPKYLTVLEEDILTIDVNNSNVKVLCEVEHSFNENNIIRSALLGKGAISVQITTLNKKMDDVVENINIQGLHKPELLFKKWTESLKVEDRPKNVDELVELFASIAAEADELMIVNEEVDE